MPKFLNKLKNLDLSTGNNEQDLYTLFLTKDEAFSYEREYRILMYSKSQKDVDFIQAPKINKIIFGIRCSDELKKVIEVRSIQFLTLSIQFMIRFIVKHHTCYIIFISFLRNRM